MFAMIVGYSFMLGPSEAPKVQAPMVCKNGVCAPAKSVVKKGFFKKFLRK